MTSITALAFSLVVLTAGTAAAADECQVPSKMKKDQKLPCIRAAGFAVDQPVLTMEQLVDGPDFNAADPEKSRFAYFTGTDDITCYFRPHYAFKGVKGQSLKYQCWQLDKDRALFSLTGEKIPTTELKIVFDKNKGGENRASLFDRADTNNAHEIEADKIKVKYLMPPGLNHDTRYNEVFTEIAATRILWALGFPADHVYPVASSTCIGCTSDPFKDNLKDNKASVHDAGVVFKVAAVGRDMPWDSIDPEDDETWSWREVAGFYSSGQFSRRQKVEYDAYRMALGLFTYHNAIDIQNRVTCAAWKPDASNPKICAQPMIFVQDVGSTFGKPGSFLSANPRGKFSAWKSQTVFKNLDACELRYPLDGDSRPLKEAQDLLVKRLASLDRERVLAIFRVARFDLMDKEQLDRLHGDGAAALNEWTDTFMSRIAEIGKARNCRP
jgi:hypothetical protein